MYTVTPDVVLNRVTSWCINFHTALNVECSERVELLNGSFEETFGNSNYNMKLIRKVLPRRAYIVTTNTLFSTSFSIIIFN